MDSINQILGNKDFAEPPEINRIKQYINEVYGSDSEVAISPKGFVIIVSSAALASSLRLNMPDIRRQLKIGRSVAIRIR